jgi:hypothetical protein
MPTSTPILQFYSSADQIQALANLGHNVPGYFLCIFAVMFLLAEFGYQRKALAQVYSWIFIAMPTLFIGFVFVSNGLPNTAKLAAIASGYPEVSLHILTLIGNIFGGVGEILYVRGKLKYPLGALCLPVLFLVDGYLSVLHPHGAGGHHDVFHNVYGSLMLTAGLLIILERLISAEVRKYFIPLAAIFIALPGIMLIGFKEPLDSYSYAFPSPISTSTPTLIAKSDNTVIYVSDTGVVPHDIQIHLGASVTFVMLGTDIHEMASGPHPQHNNYPPLNIGVLRFGEMKSVTFTRTGFFGYHDHDNDSDLRFQGSVTVMP